MPLFCIERTRDFWAVIGLGREVLRDIDEWPQVFSDPVLTSAAIEGRKKELLGVEKIKIFNLDRMFFTVHTKSFLSNVAVRPLPEGRGCEATPFGENDLWPEQIEICLFEFSNEIKYN